MAKCALSDHKPPPQEPCEAYAHAQQSGKAVPICRACKKKGLPAFVTERMTWLLGLDDTYHTPYAPEASS